MSSDDFVAEIGIDPEGRLYIRPYESSFEFIYREAMEVHWDADTRRLISPKPRQWTYVDWFRQIISAAGHYGISLRLVEGTSWINISVTLRRAIVEVSNQA